MRGARQNKKQIFCVLSGTHHKENALMLRYAPFLFCSITLLLFVNIVTAQNKVPWHQKFNPDSLVNREIKLIPMPIVQSSPETGLRVGLSMDYFFNTGKKEDTLSTRDSFAWLMATYSTRKQLAIEPIWQVYTHNEKYLLRGQAGYIDFSEYFWGIGNNTLTHDQNQSLFYTRSYIQAEFLRSVMPNVFLGLQAQLSNTQNITYPLSVEDLIQDVSGKNSSHTSGIGPNIIFDYRDNPFSPVKGWFLELSHTFHHPHLLSKHTYTESLIDVRKYFSFKNTQFIGFQFVGNLSAGDVPLRELPRLGGNQIMRGMIQGRYRDKNTIAFQSEYRKSLNRFLKIAVFGSSGIVSNQIRDISIHDAHYGYGIGLRILVNKKKNLYSRIDIARSSEGNTAFYFKLMDAF